MSKDFKYEELNQQEFQEVWKKHKSMVDGFIKDNRYKTDNLYIDELSTLSIITKVDQRKKYFEYFHNIKMSEYKETALICFWYIKLKPIRVIDKDPSIKDAVAFSSINEKLAVYYILRMLRTMLKREHKSQSALDAIPDEYIKEMIYSFTYRDISKEALILLIESMAVSLGLNPYRKFE